MSKQMPFFFDDMAEVDAKVGDSPFVILSFCCDRAPANFKACAWVWAQCTKPSAGSRLLPHVEPCALHGVQLAKCKPAACKEAVAATASLSALMRQWRFTTGMRDTIYQHVKSSLHVERGPKPEALRARAAELIDALWGHEEQHWMFKSTSPFGCFAPKQLLSDLHNMAGVVDFGSCVYNSITHYCYVVEGSAEHVAGKQIGAPCCSSREEAVDKVAVPLVNWICHKNWDQVAANRWTKVVVSLRRVLSGFV